MRVTGVSHVERQDNVAKFWLDPIRLQSKAPRITLASSFPRRREPSQTKQLDTRLRGYDGLFEMPSSGGLSRVEIGRMEKLVSKHQFELMEAWNEYFRD